MSTQPPEKWDPFDTDEAVLKVNNWAKAQDPRTASADPELDRLVAEAVRHPDPPEDLRARIEARTTRPPQPLLTQSEVRDMQLRFFLTLAERDRWNWRLWSRRERREKIESAIRRLREEGRETGRSV